MKHGSGVVTVYCQDGCRLMGGGGCARVRRYTMSKQSGTNRGWRVCKGAPVHCEQSQGKPADIEYTPRHPHTPTFTHGLVNLDCI